MFWLLGWAVHALVFRGQWSVEVAGPLKSRWSPLQTLVVGEHLAKKDAFELAERMCDRIATDGIEAVDPNRKHH